jgi:DNA-binding CsgD family transcriptional regulator
VVGFLAEAGHLGGRHAEVVAMIDEIGPVAARTGSPILRYAVAYARAVIAPDDDAPERFRQALSADLAAWPFEMARLELAYGSWLRRHRRGPEAREALRSAVTALDALGVDAWAARARRELRSVGGPAEGSADRSAGLTVQQRRIAHLAADGLSNQEIADRLFLSPRTVTTHLSRIYAKVAASSRSDLARILASRPGR